jgi:peptide/nickel transport system substrate-binding protein
MHAALRAIERGETPRFLEGQIFETLVRLNDRGEPQPWLATSWTHEPERKRWVFAARPNVALHNGTMWSPDGGVVTEPDDRPIEQILRDLARPRNAVMVRAADGSLLGTGPFRVARWDAEKSATLAAHDGYWGGRPFLDTIEIQMGRALGDQALDLEVGKADVVEIPVSEIRRRRGVNVVATELVEIIALVFENGRATDSVREALALLIDRAAIHTVLLQKQGEISGALLPRWLSGYSFLFSTERNVARARQLAGTATLTFGYDRQDAMLRAIGERISVNASEAGITMRPGTASADVRLVKLPITSRDALSALEDLAAILKTPLPPGANLYEAERALLDGHRVIPLVHLPEAWAVGARVKNWPRLADAWLDVRDKP